MARKLGLDSEVEAALRAIVPRVFSEAGTTVGFAETGDAFEKVRYRLAHAIARALIGRRRVARRGALLTWSQSGPLKNPDPR
jgi:hypothetical protein